MTPRLSELKGFKKWKVYVSLGGKKHENSAVIRQENLMAREGWKHGIQRIFHGSETSLCDAVTMGLCHCVAVQLPSYVWLFATPWTAAHQASLPFTTTWSLLKFMSIEPVILSNHLILCCPLLLLPSVFPSVKVFSKVGSSHQVAKVLELQHQSFQWIFRVDFL